MNRKIAFVLSFLVLILLVGGFAGSARAATEYDIVVHNRNSREITLSFVGLKVYQFELEPGRTTIQLEKGTYQHSYYGCGQLNFGSFTVKTTNPELEIQDCNSPGSTTPPPNAKVLNIKNRTFTSFEINLVGIDNNTDYSFTLVPGTNKLYVVPGTYRYSYYACSALHYGNVVVKPARGADMAITKCAASTNGAASTANKVTFRVKNNTGGPVYLVLKGQFNYWFTVTGSGAILTAEKGYYDYTVYGCGRTFTGAIVVGPDTALIRTPFCSGNVAQ